jgi:hypothetical protein
MSARIASVGLAMLGASVIACSDPPPPPLPLPDPSRVELAAVEGALRGSVDGRPFHALDARVRVVSFAGRERVDLLFADEAIERCGLPLARAQTRLWVRVPGVTSLAVGELDLLEERTADEANALEVHYERPNGRAFVEAHRGVLRLEITRATTEVVEGRLSACFADASGSCVAGRFRATPCRGRVDGRTLREPPGLADEALERLPTPRGATTSAQSPP